MKQIVCQYGSKKCLYLYQTSFTTLCLNIKIDFEDAPSVFQLMYIDEEAADWMIIENQKDLDKILSLNKKYALIKILPFVDRNEPNLSHTNIGKFRMTQDFRKMVQFVSNRHTQRYEQKSKTERMIRDSGMMLEQKIPPSLTKFDALPPNVCANLARKKDKTDKVSRISPQKKSIQKSIQNAVKCKFNKIIGQVIESSYESILKNRYCADCSSKQLQLERLITRELLKKIKKYQINPEE